MKQGSWYTKFAKTAARFSGRSTTFFLSALLIVVWLATGPLFHYSDTWQLVINTATTIITFLMVFLIQTMQNRDARAFHLKLDELIRSTRRARNLFTDLEDATDEELKELQAEFRKLRARAAARQQAKVAQNGQKPNQPGH